MKSFQGIASNITEPIIGRICKSKNYHLFKRNQWKDNIIISDLQQNLPKAKAYILSSKSLENNYPFKIPCIYGIPSDSVNQMTEGDIVILTNEGNINVLYEIESPHNVIFTTNRCNLRCIMCPQPSTLDSESIFENNLKLLSLMDKDKTKELAITGGEPTLIGDNLFQLIQECKEHLPKTSLMILSNGKKFSDFNFAKKLALVEHPSIFIAIPLYSDIDSIHDNIVGIKGSFFETITGLHNLAVLKQKIEIRTVIHRLNYERLPKFAYFIYHNFPFVFHIALMGMETTGLARENLSKLWIDPYDYMKQLEEAVQILYRANMNVSIYNHQLCIMPRKLWRFSRKSISSWKNIYIEKCNNCKEKEKCCGFFSTSGGIYSRYINNFN
jgi:His-Xaa-Ser system radical SAM maturase HxsC